MIRSCSTACPTGVSRGRARRSQAFRGGAWVLLWLAGACGGPAKSAPSPADDSPVISDVRRIEVPPEVVLDRTCSPTGVERCFDARDDNCNGVVDEGCGIPTGLVQFMIAWPDAAADVDLEVTDPNGDLVGVSEPTEAGLVKDRDCPGRNDECHGQNIENVYLNDGAELVRGTYRVRLRLEKMGHEEPPIEVSLGARVGPRSYAAIVRLSRVEETVEVLFEL